MLAIMLLIALASSSEAIAAKVQTGFVIWHGHTLNAPYIIGTGQDTYGNSVVTINDLPLTLRARSEGPPILPRHLADQLKAQANMMPRLLDRPTLEMIQARNVRGALGSDSSLVDSVILADKLTTKIYWRGQQSPQLITKSAFPSPRQTGPNPRIAQLENALQRGYLIIIGNGITYIPPQDARAVLDQVDQLRHGVTPAPLLIDDGHAVRDILRPRPIPVLLKEGE